jgi:hypothetical protein
MRKFYEVETDIAIKPESVSKALSDIDIRLNEVEKSILVGREPATTPEYLKAQNELLRDQINKLNCKYQEMCRKYFEIKNMK